MSNYQNKQSQAVSHQISGYSDLDHPLPKNHLKDFFSQKVHIKILLKSGISAVKTYYPPVGAGSVVYAVRSSKTIGSH